MYANNILSHEIQTLGGGRSFPSIMSVDFSLRFYMFITFINWRFSENQLVYCDLQVVYTAFLWGVVKFHVICEIRFPLDDFIYISAWKLLCVAIGRLNIMS